MKCISSCVSCLCGNKNSRITPSEPIQIIQANHSEKQHTPESRTGNAESPERNLNERIILSTVDGDKTFPDNHSNHDSAFKALYIEVGKDRVLRVIHIRSCEEDSSSTPSGKGSVKDVSATDLVDDPDNPPTKDASPENTPNANAVPLGEDDEEEYWFSKWARKPRFRSIFAKNARGSVNENNNSIRSSSGDGKVSTELEMARAAAAAKRRAWAYNNHGSRDSITHQPTTNPSDDEEFSSIAIVNTLKQQWSKGSTNSSQDKGEAESPQSPSSTVEVEVSVERHAPKDGISNPAFQSDEEDDVGRTAEMVEEDKTDNDEEERKSPNSGSSSLPNTSMKFRLSSSNSEEEDAITVEPEEDIKTSPIINPEETSATPRKPLLFFIHSISSSSDVWHHQIDHFQQLGYEVVAPDLLGHGLSSTPLNPKYYCFESLVQDLILIFDHFTKEDMKIVLIGHGYGACLAAMLTRVRLKNVGLLILMAGGGPTPLVRRTCCQDSLFSWKCKLFHSNRIRGRFDNPELKHILPALIHENVLSGQVWGDGDSAFYRRITVPTLLVYGMRDKVVTLVEECEMERTIPKSFLELIDSAGHMVMLDEPEKLNKMLCKFIQSWS